MAEDTRAFGKEQAAEMIDKLHKYAEGKRAIDQKATENQEWWRLRHWGVITGETNESHKISKDRSVGSAWAINSLLNKHADIMDSFPKPNVLAREADDEEEAKMLSSIVPVILEHNDYEGVYRQMGWDFTIDGAAITGVFWDSSKNDGMGDITISNVDVHNLSWRPGITNIQDSDVVFHVSLQDVDAVKASWPEFADVITPCNAGTVRQYLHDDHIDTSNMCEMINCYYKTFVYDPVYMDSINEETGEAERVQVHEVPRTVLHLAIMVGDEVLWCSENEPGYENGYYEHGKYPFVVRRTLPVKDSLWGFGYLDIMKNPQKDIDKLDQAIIKDAMQKANNRYWVKKNAAINKEAFSDWSEEIVEIGTGDIREQVGLIETGNVPTTAMQHLERKIDELKETSGNRDFSQGSTQSGVTAASAIAALQEAGSKLSRDINKELYRGSREEYYLIIELIRQFYDQPRTFRIQDEMGQTSYQSYSNENLKPTAEEVFPGGEIKHRKPIFDIEITAEKQSPFSRAAQNETAKEMYAMGLFHPENALPAMVCLQMMEFEGKDAVLQSIQQNSTILQQLQTAMQFISQMAMADPMIFQAAAMQGLIQMPENAGQPAMGGGPAPGGKMEGTAEERAARTETDTTRTAKARARAANASTPT